MFGLALAPVYVSQGGSEGSAHEWMQPIARRFGWASLGALVVCSPPAHRWPRTCTCGARLALSVKLGLVALAIVLTCLHVFVVHGSNRLLQVLILLDSLAIVLVATTL